MHINARTPVVLDQAGGLVFLQSMSDTTTSTFEIAIDSLTFEDLNLSFASVHYSKIRTSGTLRKHRYLIFYENTKWINFFPLSVGVGGVPSCFRKTIIIVYIGRAEKTLPLVYWQIILLIVIKLICISIEFNTRRNFNLYSKVEKFVTSETCENLFKDFFTNLDLPQLHFKFISVLEWRHHDNIYSFWLIP